MTSELTKTIFLLGYRAVFDEKGGFGGGSHRHRYKSFSQKHYLVVKFLLYLQHQNITTR